MLASGILLCLIGVFLTSYGFLGDVGHGYILRVIGPALLILGGKSYGFLGVVGHGYTVRVIGPVLLVLEDGLHLHLIDFSSKILR